jgi:DNA anti-recombination protein RmuC
MADLAAAAARLTRAVDRLEAAASAQRGRGAEKQRQLGADLAKARAEFAELMRRTDGVSERLDGAIDLLKTALEA